MRVFLDTNVVLDVFAHRQPFYDTSARVWAFAEVGKFTGLISALSMTTLYYVVRRESGRDAAGDMLRAVRRCVGLTTCDATVLESAIDAEFTDFEDAVQYFSAASAGADAIVTRNVDHFPATKIQVLTPAAFLAAHSFK